MRQFTQQDLAEMLKEPLNSKLVKEIYEGYKAALKDGYPVEIANFSITQAAKSHKASLVSPVAEIAKSSRTLRPSVAIAANRDGSVPIEEVKRAISEVIAHYEDIPASAVRGNIKKVENIQDFSKEELNLTSVKEFLKRMSEEELNAEIPAQEKEDGFGNSYLKFCAVEQLRAHKKKSWNRYVQYVEELGNTYNISKDIEASTLEEQRLIYESVK